MNKRITKFAGLVCVAIAAMEGDWFALAGWAMALAWAQEYFILKESEG